MSERARCCNYHLDGGPEVAPCSGGILTTPPEPQTPTKEPPPEQIEARRRLLHARREALLAEVGVVEHEMVRLAENHTDHPELVYADLGAAERAQEGGEGWAAPTLDVLMAKVIEERTRATVNEASPDHPHGPPDPQWVAPNGSCALCGRLVVKEQDALIAHLEALLADQERQAAEALDHQGNLWRATQDDLRAAVLRQGALEERNRRQASIIEQCPRCTLAVIEPDEGWPLEKLRKALAPAAEALCSLRCPSVWKTGTPQPHVPECAEAQRLLGAERKP